MGRWRRGLRQASGLSPGTQFVIQNSFNALGNAILEWEPRYDLCHCSGFWPRIRHAIARNFVTYNRTEREIRPQIVPYAAAFGAGAIPALWEPGNHNLLVKGYQGAVTQVGVGIGVNWLAEFAPDIKRIIRRR